MAEALPDVKALLLKTLHDLSKEEFKSFKWHLENSSDMQESELEDADRRGTVDLLVKSFPQEAIEVTMKVLKMIPRNDLVQRLSVTNPGDALR